MRRLVSLLATTTVASVVLGAATGALHWLRTKTVEREHLELRRDVLLEQLRLTSAARRVHKQRATLCQEKLWRTKYLYPMDELAWMKACDLSRGSRIRAHRAQEEWNNFCREHPDIVDLHLQRRRARWISMYFGNRASYSEER